MNILAQICMFVYMYNFFNNCVCIYAPLYCIGYARTILYIIQELRKITIKKQIHGTQCCF